MKGSIDVRVQRRRGTAFAFTLHRNITVLRGDSGTGKTTLYEMIADHTRQGDHSGVSIRCDVPCVALVDLDWWHQLKGLESDSIVFVDEGFGDIRSDAFARAVKRSRHYFVLITREDMPSLPYSVSEIYCIQTSGKYHKLARMYAERDHCRYGFHSEDPTNDFDVLLLEDSKTGLQFYESRFKKTDVTCIGAGGKGNIARWLDDHAGAHVFVIADGAAFGPHADMVLKLQDSHRDTIAVCLPESFEWLLLKSGVIHADGLVQILDNPGEYIESKEHESWEQYFTGLIQSVTRNIKNDTQDTSFVYKKGQLRAVYKKPENADKVMALIACRNIK